MFEQKDNNLVTLVTKAWIRGTEIASGLIERSLHRICPSLAPARHY